MRTFRPFFLKQGDRLPFFEVVLKNADGTTVNLTGATVVFRMAKPGSAPKVNAAADIIGAPTNGTVKYHWTAADTDTPGEFWAEWIVTYSSGQIEAFPSGAWHVIRIIETA
jgi:hypothetical protein